MTDEGQAKEFFDLFEQVRGYRPRAKVERDAYGNTRIRMDGFADVIISVHGRWDMDESQVRSFREGDEYEYAVKSGWPRGHGMASKVACIFADFYLHKKRGEKPPYFLLSHGDYLRQI
jgi:hypothetical protein